MTDAKMDALIGELAANTAALERNTAALDRAQSRPAASGAPSSGRAAGGTGGGNAGASRGTVKFGRDKGMRFADVADLGWYRNAIAQSVDDPSKAQYRQWNLDDLAAIDAEIASRSGGGQGNPAPDGAPPDFGGPPPMEDDIPFIRAFWIPAF